MPSGGAFAIVARMSALVTSLADFGGGAGDDPRACSATKDTTSASASFVITLSLVRLLYGDDDPDAAADLPNPSGSQRGREMGQRFVLLRSQEDVRRRQPRSAASSGVQVHARIVWRARRAAGDHSGAVH